MKLKLSDKAIKLIVAVGIILIALLFLSSFIGGEKMPVTQENEPAALTNEEYVEKLEKQVKAMLESIEGVGKANVMITLQNSAQNVYVAEENLNTDKQNTAEQSSSERRSSQTSILLVEDENGRRQALLKTTVEPTVKGVIVVCEGGDNPVAVSRATEAIKALFNINTTRICITKLTGEQQ